MPIATASANIALVKYWGKRDSHLNLPAAGSLSLTLEALRTTTSLERIDGAEDRLILDGVEQTGRPLRRIGELLDLFRTRAGSSGRAKVESRNAFPSASGLASSASGFAALVVAADALYGTALDSRTLSELARRASGSAARSIFGGFVRMEAGRSVDGSDAVAGPFVGSRIALSAAVAVAKVAEKEVSSTDGMELTRTTSPYHASWIAQVDRDLAACEAALKRGDFAALAEVVEGNCLAMHADAMAARPGVIYLRGVTLWAIDQVRSLRASGTPVTFTIDAGPHLVALAPPEVIEQVAERLRSHPEIAQVILSSAGGPAQVVQP